MGHLNPVLLRQNSSYPWPQRIESLEHVVLVRPAPPSVPDLAGT